MNTCKRKILEIAQTHNMVNAELLATVYGIKPITARQYLSALAKDNLLVRIGQGVYAITQKQTFTYKPSELAKEIFLKMDFSKGSSQRSTTILGLIPIPCNSLTEC